MARTTVAVVIVLGLAVGVWWLLPSDDTASSTTLPASATSTTTSPGSIPTTIGGSASTVGSSQVVTTVEEAEAILGELWFGWFEGIYNQDEDRIREVVATEEQVETARVQFGVMEFITVPTPEAIVFSETEILRSDEECLAVWVVTDVGEVLGPQATISGVEVLRRSGDGWVMLSSWIHRGDLWEDDCESLLP